MTGRFWFYLGALIVIAGLGTWQIANSRRLENEQNRIVTAGINQSREALAQYLGKQTDSRKLVSLTLMYAKTQPELVEPVALKAFELNPDSRDIALLAAPFSRAAKERVKFLDPLYAENGDEPQPEQ